MKLVFSLPFLLLACGTDVMVGKTAVDNDSDGYTAEVDCNDAAASIHPEAPETCDGVDQDCDGATDEDATDASTWYTDADTDAYGVSAAAVLACEAPSGSVAIGGDCDDGEPRAFPGNGEVCDGIDNDCNGTADDNAADATLWYTDADTDGYGDTDAATSSCDPPPGTRATPGDCDDADAGVNPAAIEVCGGVDEDCDGALDEEDPDLVDGITWYRDADADTYAPDPAVTTVACAQPTGFTAALGDCDDTDGAIHPGATEVCDAADRDEDCDSLADDADGSVDPSTWSTFHADADADAWGDPARSVTQCEAPAGWVADATDCDDGLATVHPGATETCDGVDEDCDGIVDDGAIDLRTFHLDEDGDTHGGAATITACSVSDGAVESGDDCDDGDSAVYPGAADACGDGLDADCDGADSSCPLSGVYAEADAFARIVETTASQYFPAELANAGDVNGDGYEDLLAAHEFWSGSATSQGAGLVFFGPITGLVHASDADLIFEGPTTQDRVRRASGVGDLNGDGLDDIALSSYLADPTGYRWYEGAAWVVLSPFSGTMSLAAADGDFYGGADYAACGYQLAGIGDVTGDGIPDVAFGGGNSASSTDNYVTIVPGPATGHGPCLGAGITLTGTTTTAALGPVGRGGDLNGDGVDDVVVGSMFDQTGGFYHGAVFVAYGPVSSGSMTGADRAYYGDSDNEWLGAEVLGAGDLNGDGNEDLVAAAFLDDIAYLVYGPLPSAATMASVADATFPWYSAGDGRNFETIEDLDGDGGRELIVGAPSDATYGTGFGTVGVFSAPSGSMSFGDALIVLHGDTTYDALGVSPLAIDEDGDGASSIAVGVMSDDAGATDGGAVWLF